MQNSSKPVRILDRQVRAAEAIAAQEFMTTTDVLRGLIDRGLAARAIAESCRRG